MIERLSKMIPRDVAKLAFQFHQHDEIPFNVRLYESHQEKLTAHYGNEDWHQMVRPYFHLLTGVDNLLSLAGVEELGEDRVRDCLGCVWHMGTTHHLVEPPLKEPSLAGYRLPELGPYVEQYLRPRWSEELPASRNSFRVASHSFGLFERAWSLRGFENFCRDLIENPTFCEELIEMIADWMLESIDLLLSVPVDAIMLTDDYADQRGMIFGLDRFQRFFVPQWKRIFQRIRKSGVYSILHVCGCATPGVPDLIDCGLDCLESLQPEAMDVYAFKREYGRDIRLWGGLGAQSTLPFGSAQNVRDETKRLKRELGQGGGYVLAPAKNFCDQVPIENVIAYLETASACD